MLASWTAEIVGRLHRIDASIKDLAKEAGYNYAYVSTVLNGHRDSDAAQERLMQALERLESKARRDDIVDTLVNLDDQDWQRVQSTVHEQEAQECDHD